MAKLDFPSPERGCARGKSLRRHEGFFFDTQPNAGKLFSRLIDKALPTYMRWDRIIFHKSLFL